MASDNLASRFFQQTVRWLLAALLMTLTASAFAEPVTKQMDTRDLQRAKISYEKDIASRDKSLSAILSTAQTLIKNAQASKKQAKSVPALMQLTQSIQNYQKSGGKNSTKDLTPADIKEIGKALDEFFSVADTAEKNAMSPYARELANSQSRAKQSMTRMLKAWQQSLASATGAKNGDTVVIAKRPAAGKRSVDDEQPDTGSEQIIVQSSMSVVQPTQQVFQPVIEVTYLNNGVSLSEPTATTNTVPQPTGQIRPQNMQNVTLVLVNEQDSPTMTLFDFAETTGTFDNLVVATQDDGCAAQIARENESRGYSLLFSAAGDDAECVSTSNNDVSNQNCRVCFYEHMNYGGDWYCTDDASGDLRDHDMNDKITSVRFFKSACPSAGVNLYENSNNGGWRLQLTSNSANVGATYNDKATTYTFSRNMASTIASAGSCYAKLYEHSGYRGKMVEVDPARTSISHLRSNDMNDKTTSIRINFSGCPGAQLNVYDNDSFRNTSWVYTSSTSNVGEARNDKITSVELILNP